MLRDLKLNVFYPYSPDKVWRAITNRQVLAQWLMENDFEPRIGHKFRFQPQPHQGIDEAIDCEVIELDEPRSLSYTWRGGFISKPTLVTWKLVPVDGGTQLQIEHKGFESHAIASVAAQKVNVQSQSMQQLQTWHDSSMPKACLETRMLAPIEQRLPFSAGYGRVKSVDIATLNFYLDGGWHAALNHRLKILLGEIAQPIGALSRT
jgi:uncharacterized protein YndB with AHSA1/START domain